MRILALDLGTKCGFAHNIMGTMGAGTWELASAKEITAWGKARLNRRADPRVYRLFSLLWQYAEAPLTCPNLVVFEDIQFSTYTYQTQLWSSLRAAIWIAFDGTGAKIDCLGVTQLKQFAGSGSYKKKDMADALFRLSPEWKSAKLDDNAIDAIWLHKWATKTYGG